MKIVNKIFDLGLGTKVFLSILIITIFLLGMMFVVFRYLGAVSYDIEKKSLDETTILIKRDLVTHTKAQANIYNFTFKNWVVGLEEVKNNVIDDNFKEKSLVNYYYRNQLISHIYFFQSDDSFIAVPAIEEKKQKDEYIAAVNELRLEYNEQYFGNWIGPYVKDGESIISYILPVWRDDVFLGVLGIDVKTNILFTDTVRIDPSESSYAVLIKHSGEFISSSKKIFEDFNMNLDESNILNNELLNKYSPYLFDPRGDIDGIFNIKQKYGNEKIITFAYIPSFSGKILVISPLNEVIQVQTEKANEIQQVLERVALNGALSIVFLIIFVSLYFFYFINLFVLTPVFNLQKGIESLKKFGSNYKIKVKYKDEIGNLASDFNIMSEKLSDSFKKLRLEKKRAEQAQAKNRAVISSVGEALIVTDSRGNCIMLNREAEKLFDLSEKKDNGKSIYDLIKLQDQKGNVVTLNKMPLLIALKKGKIINKVMYLLKNGIKIPLSITASPVFSQNKIIGGMALFNDITKEQQIDRAKTEFVSLASHQLRTPLTAVNWILQELSRMTKFNKKESAYIQDAIASNDRMTNLVGELLNVSRLEAGNIKMTIQKTYIGHIITETIKEFKPQIKERSQKINFIQPSGKIILDLDSHLLHQVLSNLLSNAIAYSKNKSIITIRLIKIAGRVVLKINDSGIGISKNQQHRMFEKFFRTDEATKMSTTGSGLGMYIAKKITEACKWQLTFTSKEHYGSEFILTIPNKKYVKIKKKKL